MPRTPRFLLPGQPHHVTQRGVDRMAIFVAPEDRLHFRESLGQACRSHECALHAYVLMTNHVHLLITPPSARALVSVMQSVGTRYARYFNAASHRTGPLFEGRYRAGVVHEARHLLASHRYIELNPVRAGIVSAPKDYAWSSHRHNALGEADPLVTPHPLFDGLGENRFQRCAAYRALFEAPMPPDILHALRGAMLRNGVTVGRANGAAARRQAHAQA